MNRFPSAVRGFLFAPALICLFFLIKGFCPTSAAGSCFTDQFAVPIFLPLIAIYKVFGTSGVIGGHDFLFTLIYWSLTGFFIGLILDLYSRRSQYSPEQHPLP
jgi:hypothetical protein